VKINTDSDKAPEAILLVNTNKMIDDDFVLLVPDDCGNDGRRPYAGRLRSGFPRRAIPVSEICGFL